MSATPPRAGRADEVKGVTARPERLPFKTKLAYGVGGTAGSMALYTLNTFALLFYNQVLGVPAHLVGIALSVSLVLDGFCDLAVGSVSDRTRSRWGRRHPYMFGAILPLAGSVLAVFSPLVLGASALVAWCVAFVLTLRLAATFFVSTHLALGGELSPDYDERSSVMAYCTIFLWVGGTASWLLALGWFFPTTPQYANGLLNPAPWTRFALTVAGTILAAGLASAWLTRDRIPYLPKPAPAARPGVRELARDLKRAFANANYVWLLLAFAFLSLMNGLRGALWLYTASFFWQLKTEQMTWFAAASFIGYGSGFLVTTRLHRRFDKRATIVASALTQVAGPAAVLMLGLAGVLSSGTPGIAVILVALSVLDHGSESILTASVWSALADVADENELRFGVRQEGVFYATRTFFSKVDLAIGAALGGALLTLIAFPDKAQPGGVPGDVLTKLVAASLLSVVPGLVAVFCYSRYRITRQQYQATKAALAARAAKAP
jgi:Na+/melibiose symporter-like transporter